MGNTVQIKTKYLVTSFFTDKLLATFDNVSGKNKLLIYSFFHIAIEVAPLFYDLIDSYSVVKVNRKMSSSPHPSIHLVAMLPLPGYTNTKMEIMIKEVLTRHCELGDLQ